MWAILDKRTARNSRAIIMETKSNPFYEWQLSIPQQDDRSLIVPLLLSQTTPAGGSEHDNRSVHWSSHQAIGLFLFNIYKIAHQTTASTAQWPLLSAFTPVPNWVQTVQVSVQLVKQNETWFLSFACFISYENRFYSGVQKIFTKFNCFIFQLSEFVSNTGVGVGEEGYILLKYLA